MVGDGRRAPAFVRGGEALGTLVDAAYSRDSGALGSARTAVLEQLGEEALIDAAAVFGNFQRMVRIADGTGIPLDAPIQALTSDLHGQLGLTSFRSAANSRRQRWWRRPVEWLVRRTVRGIIRGSSTRVDPSL